MTSLKPSSKVFAITAWVLICVLFSSAWAVPVCHVIDGNTFYTCDGRSIQLSGARAPGLNEPYGPASRDYLAQLVQNKDVTLNYPNAPAFVTAPGSTITVASGSCYVTRFITITDPFGRPTQQYTSNVPCQDLATSQTPQLSSVTTGPLDVVQQMVSQGWAVDTTGKYKASENLARGLRLGIWRQ